MTQVVIPAVMDGAGGHLPATVSIRLVGADTQGRIAFLATDLATEYQDLALPATGLTLDLAAQSDLALPAAAETWYRIEIRTPRRRDRDRLAGRPVTPVLATLAQAATL